MDSKSKRIDFLDGLRGIAILLVIFYHAYSRWTWLVPYGNKYSNFIVFKYGFLGVELFFLISGFVILMTLEKCKSFSFFIYKRWIRLFPAMLIAVILVYSTSGFLYERPYGNPKINSIIPGLLFIQPALIKFITGIQIDSIEGVFWSLFVEVKFYFIFGASYFIFGKFKAISILVMLFFLFIFSVLFHLKFITLISEALALNSFGWFASGCLSYLFYSSNQIKYLILSFTVSLIGIYVNSNNVYDICSSLIIYIIFTLPIFYKKSIKIFNTRFFIFMGFISYPLYLIHENAMISMIIKFHHFIPFFPEIFLPILPIIILCIIAFLIANSVEYKVRMIVEKSVGYILFKINKNKSV